MLWNYRLTEMPILLQVNSHEGKGYARPIDTRGIYLNIFIAVTHDHRYMWYTHDHRYMWYTHDHRYMWYLSEYFHSSYTWQAVLCQISSGGFSDLPPCTNTASRSATKALRCFDEEENRKQTKYFSKKSPFSFSFLTTTRQNWAHTPTKKTTKTRKKKLSN